MTWEREPTEPGWYWAKLPKGYPRSLLMACVYETTSPYYPDAVQRVIFFRLDGTNPSGARLRDLPGGSRGFLWLRILPPKGERKPRKKAPRVRP